MRSRYPCPECGNYLVKTEWEEVNDGKYGVGYRYLASTGRLICLECGHAFRLPEFD